MTYNQLFITFLSPPMHAPIKISRYSQILGLSHPITEGEVRRLYREKAKLLHPDKNRHPESHEQFLQLHEAYEYFIQYLRNKELQSKKQSPSESEKYRHRYRQDPWNYGQQMQARRKAARRAKMKYEQFEKQGYPQLFDKIFFVFDVFGLLLTLCLLIVLPVFLFLQQGALGMLVALFVQAITFSQWSKTITRFL